MLRPSLLAASVLAALSLFFITSATQRSAIEAVPVIGEGSCLEISACVGLGANAIIGENSCNELQSCVSLNGTVGDNSCNEVQSCVSLTGDVGDFSCNQVQSCVSLTGNVGDRSCASVQSCVSLSGDIGDDSCWTTQICVAFSGILGDCERNPACDVELTKKADPSTIPSTGGTTVNYSIQIEFTGDVQLNSITDDQYILNPSSECDVVNPSGQNAGHPSLPQSLSDGWSVVCEYETEPPAGDSEGSVINVVTINIGIGAYSCTTASLLSISDIPGIAALQLAPVEVSPSACLVGTEIGASAVTPNGDGTIDITAEASVRYVAERRNEPQRPNIGAGLSGLFVGQPTPLPTTPPSAVMPASPTIRPPNTGSGGLAQEGSASTSPVVVSAALLVFTILIVGVKKVSR
jgi:hypothetical protein